MPTFDSVCLVGLGAVLLGASCSLCVDVSGLTGSAAPPEGGGAANADADLGDRSGALALEPASATLDPGQTLQFFGKRELPGIVSWSVVEASSGGRIEASGMYSAPCAAGMFHVVAKVGFSTASAVVTGPPSIMLVAGRTDGYVDGSQRDARFRYPSGCVLDRQGNVFITERNNSVIRRIDAA